MSALPSTLPLSAPDIEILIPTVRVGIFVSPGHEGQLTPEHLQLARWRHHDGEISIVQQGVWPISPIAVLSHIALLPVNTFTVKDTWEDAWSIMMAYVTHALVFIAPDDTDLTAWLASDARPRRPTLTTHL